jgi:E3 ubiquitin-protein ligase HUWE1
MMQSSGTAEGLRGLIDSSILQSIKKVIKYRGLFGPTVVPLGRPQISFPLKFVLNKF